MLVVAGGSLDPHVQRTLARARARGIAARGLLVGPGALPRIRFSTAEGRLFVDDVEVAARAIWVRHDVFAALADPRPAVSRQALDWYEALIGWATLRPEVRALNRGALLRRPNKVAALGLARALGLRTPRTWVTNDLARLREEGAAGRVAKPIRGGGLCLPLSEALAEQEGAAPAGPSPALVEEMLVGPEVRVTLVGGRAFAFEIETAALDHRADPDAPVRPVEAPPPAVLEPLRALARALGLDLCAADFKRERESGALVMLEINSQPMFTAYDSACGGAIVDAILDLLVGEAVMAGAGGGGGR